MQLQQQQTVVDYASTIYRNNNKRSGEINKEKKCFTSFYLYCVTITFKITERIAHRFAKYL